jgi:hypothetical protein
MPLIVRTQATEAVRSTVFDWALAFAALGCGFVLTLEYGRLLGDMSDSLLNLYFLEHGYRWLAGLEPSFWSPRFFYPAANVLAYSDAHIGTLPIYAAMRGLGVNREASMFGWTVVVEAFNFIAAIWACRKLGLPMLASVIAAYLFTFGLPVTAQSGHVQLLPRFFVPPAFYCLARLLQDGRLRFWHGLLFSIVGQLYVGIYNGYFLLLCLAATALGWWIAGSRTSFETHLAWAKNLGLWRGLPGAVVAGAALLPLAIPYARAPQSVGSRGWVEISSMLPRVSSYLRGPDSILWGKILPDTDSLPMAHEHAVFIGLLPSAALLWLALRLWKQPAKRDRERIAKALLLGVAITFLLTLSVYGFSLYRVVTWLPGAGGIRVVTRIVLVLLFPIAVLTAIAVDGWTSGLADRWGPSSAWVLSLMLVALCIADQSARVMSFRAAEARALVDGMKESLSLTGKPIVWLSEVSDAGAVFNTHILVMLASQELGLATLNGYSGNLPPNYPHEMFLLKKDRCAAYTTWLVLNAPTLAREQVGQIARTPCDANEKLAHPILERGFYDWEESLGYRSWASGRQATLLVPASSATASALSFDVETLRPRVLTIREPGCGQQVLQLRPGVTEKVRIVMPAVGGMHRIEFETDEPARLPGNGDKRPLSFSIMNAFID